MANMLPSICGGSKDIVCPTNSTRPNAGSASIGRYTFVTGLDLRRDPMLNDLLTIATRVTCKNSLCRWPSPPRLAPVP